MGTGSTLTFFFVSTAGNATSSASGRILSYIGAGQSLDYNNAGSWTIHRLNSTTLQFFRAGSVICNFPVTADPAIHRIIATVNPSGVLTARRIACTVRPACPTGRVPRRSFPHVLRDRSGDPDARGAAGAAGS